MATKETNLKLQDIAKRLNKEYSNNNLIIKADVVPYYNRLASCLMGFDYALWGGLTTGRVHVFSGLEHSGKTLASMAFLAAYQREHPDKICVIGAGHAGCEAALALARTGFKTVMLTLNLDSIAFKNFCIGFAIVDLIPMSFVKSFSRSLAD